MTAAEAASGLMSPARANPELSAARRPTAPVWAGTLKPAATAMKRILQTRPSAIWRRKGSGRESQRDEGSKFYHSNLGLEMGTFVEPNR